MIDDEIAKTANKASLKITTDDNDVIIKQIFRWSDSATLGVLFFFLGGLFLAVISFFKTTGMISKVLGFIIGIPLIILSAMTLIRQIADGLQIKDDSIYFRYNLKQTVLPVNSNMKVKMKTEVKRVKRVTSTQESTFIVITHYLLHANEEIPVLSFQIKNSNADEAKKLGNKITQLINERLKA